MFQNIIRQSSKYQFLNKIVVNGFSIKNYMKTYEVQCVERPHNLFRVDENKMLQTNQQQLNKFISKEQQSYELLSKKWSNRSKEYYAKASQRRDIRNKSIQQKFDNYGYFTKVKYIENRQYTTIYRRNLDTNQEELVLDIMKYQSIKRHFSTVQLVKTSFSQNHQYIAFGFDLHNNETLRFMIRDIQNNKIVQVKGWEKNAIQDVNNIVWYKDQGFFYLKTQNRRPSNLFFQTFDTKPELIFEETDGSRWVDISVTKDKTHLVISSSNKNNCNIKCLKLIGLPQNFVFNEAFFSKQHFQIGKSELVQKVHAGHCRDFFVIWRQKQSSNTISILKDQTNEQKIIYKLQDQETLSDMDIFQNYILLYVQKNTEPILRVINIFEDRFQFQQPKLPYSIGKITPGSNDTYKSDKCILHISTPFVYNQGYQYDLIKKKFKVVQKFQLSGPKFNMNKYEIKTVNIPSATGDMIPATILSKKISNMYPHKLVLKVYGFYGLSNEVSYDNMNYALLQNNWTIVYAHIRGGSDKGKSWHLAALNNKNITWNDIQDTVAYLIKQKYTHPSLLFLQSHSAGAIAVWNAINKSPHLYKGIVLNFPFLDVLGSLMNQKDSLAQSDYAQFGNPLLDKNAYRKIQAISPYDNIEQKAYPFIYIVGGLNDYRCPVSQLTKFVKRFRQVTQENNRYFPISEKGILLKVQQNSSHLGSSDVSQQNQNNCEIYAFLDHLVYDASNDCKY